MILLLDNFSSDAMPYRFNDCCTFASNKGICFLTTNIMVQQYCKSQLGFSYTEMVVGRSRLLGLLAKIICDRLFKTNLVRYHFFKISNINI